MMELLLEEAIQVKDALLLAISEEYVEGVELLVQVSALFMAVSHFMVRTNQKSPDQNYTVCFV